MRAAGCRQVSQCGFQLLLFAHMEVLFDAATLLCFGSPRGLSRPEGPCGERERGMLYTVSGCLASEYCVEGKGGYCLVLSSGLPVTLNHVGNDPSQL